MDQEDSLRLQEKFGEQTGSRRRKICESGIRTAADDDEPWDDRIRGRRVGVRSAYRHAETVLEKYVGRRGAENVVDAIMPCTDHLLFVKPPSSLGGNVLSRMYLSFFFYVYEF